MSLQAIPSLDTLARSARREIVLDYLLLTAIWAAIGGMAWRLLALRQPGLLGLALLFMLLSSLAHLGGVVAIMRLPGRRVKHLRLPERVGAYTAADIQRMVAELLAPHQRRRRELPAIYITESADGNAFVVNSLLFNFIKPLNAIYISRRLFTILRPAEIKAILAHELGHFYGHMRPLNRNRSALMLLNALLPLQLGATVSTLSFGVLVASWYATSFVLSVPLGRWLGRHSRTFEFLSDLHAARRYGILPLVNGLLGIIKTAELEYLLHKRLLQILRADTTLTLAHLPDLLDQLNRALPAGPAGAADIDRALEQVLRSERTRRLRRQETPSQTAEETQKIDTLVEQFLMNRTFDLVDWSTWDNHTPDGRVDEAEYPRLIEALTAASDRQLFAIPQDNDAIAAHGTHPSTRERILFLEKCRRSDPSLTLRPPPTTHRSPPAARPARRPADTARP